MIDHARLERYVTDSRRRFEDLLGQMVEIPSISMDPAKALTSGAWRNSRGRSSPIWGLTPRLWRPAAIRSCPAA